MSWPSFANSWRDSFFLVLHYVFAIELQSGVEIIVRHNVHLTHLRVHVPLNSHQPDDGRLPTSLCSCLGVILKILANSVHNFRQMLIGSRIRDQFPAFLGTVSTYPEGANLHFLFRINLVNHPLNLLHQMTLQT